ncbi:MAG: hypothetical protein AAB506_01090 [Patescibacteria group bacterium]
MLLLILALAVPFSQMNLILNLASIFLALIPRKLIAVILLLIAAQIFVSTDQNIVRQLSQPLGKEYTTDMRAFLKTYQLMKEGQNFYPAFATSMAGLRDGNFHPDINAWRQPFIFYLWKILPGDGVGIYILWQLFLVAIIISAYLIAKNILSPLILWPFLRYSLVDLTILQPEWWGMAFLVFGLCFFTYKKYYLSGLFFLLSLMCRELFIIPIFFLTLIRFRKYLPFYILFAAYYFFYHLPNIFAFPTEIFRNYANGNWKTLHSIFAYSSWNYLIGVYRPTLLIFVATMVFAIIKRKNLYYLLTFLPFFIFTGIMAMTGKIDATRDYWSIYFVPLLLISAPALILPPEK